MRYFFIFCLIIFYIFSGDPNIIISSIAVTPMLSMGRYIDSFLLILQIIASFIEMIITIKLINLFYNRKIDELPFYPGRGWIKFFIFALAFNSIKCILYMKYLSGFDLYSIIYLSIDIIFLLIYSYFLIEKNERKIASTTKIFSYMMIAMLSILIIINLLPALLLIFIAVK